jgi:hypothetical protein
MVRAELTGSNGGMYPSDQVASTPVPWEPPLHPSLKRRLPHFPLRALLGKVSHRVKACERCDVTSLPFEMQPRRCT